MSVDEFHLKKEARDDNDRISSLPDDLLCRILSLLLTKQAAATTVLSTRWKNLFTSLPDLIFDSKAQTTRFFSFEVFLHKVLRERITTSASIRKFHLNDIKGPYVTSLVCSWICGALRCNVQDLFISAESMITPTSLPPMLFSCTTLKTLRLWGKFVLSVPSYVCFPSLKTLELSDLVLTDDKSVMRFFQGCIVLENLCLFSCVIDTISVLEVSIASLEHLGLYDMNGDYVFLLDAPRLQFLCCSSYATKGYYGNILNSLLSANVNILLRYEHFGDEKVSQLINMVSNTRSLSLSRDSLEPLMHHSATFPNMTKLNVDPDRAGGWFSLPNLLHKAPCLEVLCFDGGLHDEYNNYFDASSCLPDRVPACVTAHLKKVNIGYFNGEEDEFKLVEYFLKNGKVLEKMTITPELDYSSDGPILDVKKHFSMTKRLLKLRRSSKACQIVFTDGE